MNINHHPGEELLLDYASGALGEAWSLAVATHLALCPACRRAVERLESLGAGMMDGLDPAPLADGALDAVLARLDESGAPAPRPAAGESPQDPAPVLPQPLRGYLGGDVPSVRWRSLGKGIQQARIRTGRGRAKVRLLRIPAGRAVPDHTHHGPELAVVLAGAYVDATGEYGRGDLQQTEADLRHKPRAAPGDDCICLVVNDGPIRFRSLVTRLVQPFLGI